MVLKGHFLLFTMLTFFFRFRLIESSKEHNLFEIENICEIMHVFAVTWMHPWWKKYIYIYIPFKKLKLYRPHTFKYIYFKPTTMHSTFY